MVTARATGGETPVTTHASESAYTTNIESQTTTRKVASPRKRAEANYMNPNQE